jgi:Fe-S-cluster-containing hydrogenase component 2
VPPKNITFLAAADFDLTRGETMRLRAGELFGEIGAMNGWPQSVSARTATTCTLVQIRVPAIRKLRRKSKRLKQRLDDLYRSRTLRQHLSATPILDGCGSDTIEQLVARVELISCQPGDVVTREGEPVEHLILVRSGSLKMSQALGVGVVVVSYVSKGATVGESELLLDDLGTWNVTTTSVGHSELVRIPKSDFLEVVQRNPNLQQRLWAIGTTRIKELGFRRNNLERADLLDFTLAKGLTQANSVLVIDLETCTRCDDCVRACASTHGGTQRFVREGEVYDGFMVARSCYHCQDPTCLVGCPTGAITRLNIGDVVAIDPTVCIGCGACAENCPYDAIVMDDLGVTWGADAMPKHLRGQPRAVATKCDLCYSAPQGPACVSSCPHGAAFRVAGAEEFDALLETRRRAVRAR